MTGWVVSRFQVLIVSHLITLGTNALHVRNTLVNVEFEHDPDSLMLCTAKISGEMNEIRCPKKKSDLRI